MLPGLEIIVHILNDGKPKNDPLAQILKQLTFGTDRVSQVLERHTQTHTRTHNLGARRREGNQSQHENIRGHDKQAMAKMECTERGSY